MTMDMKFLIYVLVNKDTGKRYVGKTNNLNRRICEHIRQSSCQYLYNAIQKYGIDKFEIVVVERNLTEDGAFEREHYYIKLYNSLAPNGYNLTDETFLGRVPSDKTREKMSISRQGHRFNKLQSSKFIGVKVDKKTYSCSIDKGGITYRKGFKTEIEAAICYDKLAIYLYGDNAKLNFPSKKDEFLSEDLKKYVEDIIYKKHSSEYTGVSWDKSCQKWKAYKQINKINYYIGVFNTENEASVARVKFVENFSKAVDSLTGNPVVVPMAHK